MNERQNNQRTEGLLIDYEHQQVYKIKDGRIKKVKSLEILFQILLKTIIS